MHARTLISPGSLRSSIETDRNISVCLFETQDGEGEKEGRIWRVYARLDNRLNAGIGRPSRLNCDQGLNGDSQGRSKYVTAFYDLFAFVRAVPARIIDSVRRNSVHLVCSVARGRTPERTLRSNPDRAVSFPCRNPQMARCCPRNEIEAGINFTVRRGKETLRGTDGIGDREYLRRWLHYSSTFGLTKDL